VAEQEQESPEGRKLPIEWYFPGDITSRYATNLVVQSTEHEFTISFFEIRQPILLGDPEDRKAQLEQIKSIRAECVARIIVAGERMAEFVDVLQKRLDIFQASREKLPPQASEAE
jgi:hypothetical protein